MKKGNVLFEGSYLDTYPYLVASNGVGNRCGYVRVPRKHPLFLIDRMDVRVYELDVHGGVTWSAKRLPWQRDVKFSYHWWIGYDCAHAWDGADRSLMSDELVEFFEASGTKTLELMESFGPIRTTKYCIEQCVYLAHQLHTIQAHE